MGTRADFYVGRGANAEWIGSVERFGDQKKMPKKVFLAPNEMQFRERVLEFLDTHQDSAHYPIAGWPWSWASSRATDFTYAFDKGRVFVSRFGGPWFNALRRWQADRRRRDAELPDMSKRHARIEIEIVQADRPD